MNFGHMKPGVLGAAVLVLGAGGYFGYEEWQKREATRKREAEGQATRDKAERDNQPKAEKPRPKPKAVPDLYGLTPDVARQQVKTAGFDPEKFIVLDAQFGCRYADEIDMVTQGTICNQEPSKDAVVDVTREIKVTIERDTFEHGSVGTTSEWRRMPDVLGMSKDEALATLTRAGFKASEFRIDLQQGCSLNAVCDTTPPPRGRKVHAREGVLTIGQ